MVLVDTTVWVDHLRAGDDVLVKLLDSGMALTHAFVIGEIALGHLSSRELVLRMLLQLPKVVAATDAEVLPFIDKHKLFGLGIGYIDAHLLAAVRLTAGATLWTRDKRLKSVADNLGLAMAKP